jgi:hypothetical protein
MNRMGITCLMLLGLASTGQATDLVLLYGTTEVDVNADGLNDMIVKTRWHNGNAHDFDIYKVALQTKDEQGHIEYQEVPLGPTFPYLFATTEGSDCVTDDDRAFHTAYTFKLDAKGMLNVEKYQRRWKHPAPAYPIEVTTYRLTGSEGDTVGVAPVYLKKISTQKRPGQFCDIRDAMPKN